MLFAQTLRTVYTKIWYQSLYRTHSNDRGSEVKQTVIVLHGESITDQASPRTADRDCVVIRVLVRSEQRCAGTTYFRYRASD